MGWRWLPTGSAERHSATAKSGAGTSASRSVTAATGVNTPSTNRSAKDRPHSSPSGTRRSRSSSAATPSTAAARPGRNRTPLNGASASEDHAAVSGPATNAVPSPTTKSTQPSGTIRFGPSETDRHTHLATPRNAGGAAASSYTTPIILRRTDKNRRPGTHPSG